ncbi:hypothetical protein LCM27_14885 [Ruegeria marisrubri]|uniref:hypothetical protein n=1 Tax=Ruegeria marisrubri TaxID=1685379 RepID=UPI001CD785A7|nr:hypothetical protein [Ruegeria marisrubri]MCA0907686.1 hypothetical protein [Ruegeria marisrubri]
MTGLHDRTPANALASGRSGSDDGRAVEMVEVLLEAVTLLLLFGLVAGAWDRLSTKKTAPEGAAF